MALTCVLNFGDCPGRSKPESVCIPADAGLWTGLEHGLKGDGKTDDTAALLKLVRASLDQHKTRFFPAATLLLSDTITWANEQGQFWPFLTWQGARTPHPTEF